MTVGSESKGLNPHSPSTSCMNFDVTVPQFLYFSIWFSVYYPVLKLREIILVKARPQDLAQAGITQ